MEASSHVKFMRWVQRFNRKNREKNRGDLYNDVFQQLDINYLSDGDSRHTLDYYSLKDCAFAPVILELHGGGYISGDKDINRIHARWFAQQGFKVINGEYTLFPEATFENTMQEIAHIVRWIENHSEEYGFDLQHVYLTGDSAGGHIVLLYSLVQENEFLRDYYHVELPKTRFKAVVPTCPAVRIVYIAKEGRKRRDLDTIISDAVFSNCPPAQEYLDNNDITLLVHKCKTLPCFMVETPTDGLCYKSGQQLVEACKAAGKPIEFKTYIGKSRKLQHVFNVLYPEWEESIEANNDIVNFFKKY